MKRVVSIGIMLILSTLFITGCNNKQNVGNTAEIVVEESGSIPYSWEYSIADKEIVEYSTTKEDANNDSEMIGNATKVHYIFKGLKEGRTTIKFELKSVTDNEVTETKTYEVIVDKNLNITINENNQI